MVEQANLPGTVNEQPNWRRKLPVSLQALAAGERMQGLAARLRATRPASRARSAQQDTPQNTPQDLRARVPRATYRLQFHKDFGFDDAVRVLPYLAQLGVSHVYCSPIQRAARAACTATTWWRTTRSTPSWAARRASRASSRR